MATAVWRDLTLGTDGDLTITGGDFVLLSGAESIRQQVQVALALWVGEYPFDTTLGTDWKTILETKGITDAQISTELVRVAKSVPGVVGVDNVQISRDTVSRRATISMSVTADTGEVLIVPVPEVL